MRTWLLWLSVAGTLCQLLVGCTPSPPAEAKPDPTIAALQTQVSDLSARLEPTRTPAPPPQRAPAAAPAPTALIIGDSAVQAASLADPEEVVALAEPTDVPIARPPTAFPTRTPRMLTASDAEPCEVGQVKGNISSKIYHVPLGGSYARTKNRVVCFDTEAEAQAAGYRKARN